MISNSQRVVMRNSRGISMNSFPVPCGPMRSPIQGIFMAALPEGAS